MARPPLPRRLRGSVTIPLEILSAASIKRSVAATKQFAELIFDVNVASWRRQAAAVREEILRSMVVASLGPFEFQRWQRVVTYRYSHAPLSCAGSVVSLAGGRFNYGAFDPVSSPAFPALYVAEDRETAWSERYGYTLSEPTALTASELALTRTESIAYLSVSGRVQRVVDLREPERLEPFLAIVRAFNLGPDLMARARALNMNPTFVKDTDSLIALLLDRDWRFFPMGFDVPAFSQQFGQLVLAAGIGGIVYPSTRTTGGRCCVALFPANFAESTSEVTIDDAAPPDATHTRLDSANYRDFLDL